jgi:predicted nucleotidyltransferase
MRPNIPSFTNVLFSLGQQRVLELLFLYPDRAFYVNEMMRLSGSGKGALQRELARLSSAGLISVRDVGNQKHYQANRDSPIFHELRGIVLKTFGLADVLRQALQPSAGQIEMAFVFGSVAKGLDTSASDIDVLLICDDLSYPDVLALLQPAEVALGRRVNPALYSREEWQRRRTEGNDFVNRVAVGEKIFLIGSMRELEQLG